ncbi:hypothetical protein PAXRUDRAFT_131282 [Paxillus rubicundulus Ve08.2h10]|uniref:Tc1-like transposase DDE domain-containing protein n=1 Tax=Paxillus rubicundulus Ve08.2h10 TaxID=930991 RepID=A0A0D0DWJ9_9AGAM|nr:hypothetical protein PAXRUDRAFT_131282 [Paxillus rubicundulus Ve08.2h10]
MAQYTQDELVFIDETSKDERTLSQRCGWAKKSHCASRRGVFICGQRLTAVAAMSCDGIIASHVIKGSLCHKGFLEFIKHSVLPHCTAYPGKHSVLVMDNARIHHGAEIFELMEQFDIVQTMLT